MFEAAHKDDGRRGALKVYKGTKSSTIKKEKLRVRRMRAAREVQTLELLQDWSGLPSVYDHNISSKTEELFAVFEYVDGLTLDKWVEGNGPMSVPACVDFCKVLGATLDELHALDLVHRDLKPANVILRGGAPQLPVLLDLGLVGGRPLEKVTQTEEAMRNEFMIVPELASPHEPTRATDTAMFAGLVYYVLCNVRPVQLRDGQGRMPHERAFPDVAGLSSAQKARLAMLFSRAFQYLPAARFQSCGEIVRELTRIVEEPHDMSGIDDSLRKALTELVTAKGRAAVASLRFRDLVVQAMGEYPRHDSNLLFADEGVSAHSGFDFGLGPERIGFEVHFTVFVKVHTLSGATMAAITFAAAFASSEDTSLVVLEERGDAVGKASPIPPIAADESGAKLIAQIVRARADECTQNLLELAIWRARKRQEEGS